MVMLFILQYPRKRKEKKTKPISDLDKHTHTHNLFYIILIYLQFTDHFLQWKCGGEWNTFGVLAWEHGHPHLQRFSCWNCLNQSDTKACEPGRSGSRLLMQLKKTSLLNTNKRLYHLHKEGAGAWGSQLLPTELLWLSREHVTWD